MRSPLSKNWHPEALSVVGPRIRIAVHGGVIKTQLVDSALALIMSAGGKTVLEQVRQVLTS
jgi:hypothetical protein